MQTAAPQLHGWVTKDIAKLRAIGVDPTPAEIVWLADLCRLAHTPPGREARLDLGAPLFVAGVQFWPLTMLAGNWFVVWFEALEGYTAQCVALYPFAHTRSKPGDVSLRELSSLPLVLSAIDAWISDCPISIKSIPDLYHDLMRLNSEHGDAVPNPDKPVAEVGRVQTLEEKTALLCERFEGTNPNFWLSEISERSALEMAAASASAAGGEDSWSGSPARARRIASYINAVKWIAKRGLSAEPKAT